MKHSSSQINVYQKNISRESNKSPPIRTSTKSFFNNHNLDNGINNDIKQVLSSKNNKKISKIFLKSHDILKKSQSSLKIKTFMKKDEMFYLPSIKRNKPVKVKSFTAETYNLNKEIIKSVSEKKNLIEFTGQIYLDQSNQSSKDEEEKNENIDNIISSKDFSNKEINTNSLELLNQYGFNQVYKDVIKFINLPKENIVNDVYETLNLKSLNKKILLKQTKSTLSIPEEKCFKYEGKRFYFEEKINPQIIIKNHHTWRQININFSFPYFLKDRNLLFKIMEQNSEKLKKYNKLK